MRMAFPSAPGDLTTSGGNVGTTAISRNDAAPGLYRNTKRWEEARGYRCEPSLEHADGRGHNSAPETGSSTPRCARQTSPPRRVPPIEIGEQRELLQSVVRKLEVVLLGVHLQVLG